MAIAANDAYASAVIWKKKSSVEFYTDVEFDKAKAKLTKINS